MNHCVASTAIHSINHHPIPDSWKIRIGGGIVSQLSRNAIEAGALSEKRFENYVKLQKEVGYEGLNSRQLEQEKIKSMFGCLGEMKQIMKHVKNKNKR